MDARGDAGAEGGFRLRHHHVLARRAAARATAKPTTPAPITKLACDFRSQGKSARRDRMEK
jgi:hypothetical protein